MSAEYKGDEAKEASRLEMLKRANMAEWQTIGPIACIDGREDTEAVIGVPGGDAGLFMAMLATAEKQSGKQLSKEEMALALERVAANKGGNFYFHTDHHANSPKAGQEVKENCIGCGHLKVALKNAEKYGVRRDLIKDVLGLLYGRVKEEESVRREIKLFKLVNLPGDHQEQGVIIVLDGNKDRNTSRNTKVPALKPNKDGKQFFVFHQDVAKAVVGDMAAQVNKILPGLNLNETKFRADMEKLFLAQTGLTVDALARDKKTRKPLPVLVVKIFQDKDGKTIVEEQK